MSLPGENGPGSLQPCLVLHLPSFSSVLETESTELWHYINLSIIIIIITSLIEWEENDPERLKHSLHLLLCHISLAVN